MNGLKWSASEKKIARSAYDAALERVFAKLVSEFREIAAVAASPSDLWDIEDHLRGRRRELQEILDYRYSRLLFTFGWFIREGYLDEKELAGLPEEKLDIVRRLVSR